MDRIIAILDFGSQYTQVVARRIRECHVHSKIFPCDINAKELRKYKLAGIILSGGPSSVFEAGAPLPDAKIFKFNVPILGICYGLQVMGALLGGSVAKSHRREYGHGMLKVRRKGNLLRGLPETFGVWNSHGDKLEKLPDGFKTIGSTGNSPNAAIEDAKRCFYGLQFHPEVAHTKGGIQIMKNFLDICNCDRNWKMADYVDLSIKQIKERVGGDRVVLGLSGGVDSSVAAALIHRAIGDRLTCIFIDNGLLRLGERDEVVRIFRNHFDINLQVISAKSYFLGALKNISNPERKRKVIGKAFVEIFEKSIRKIDSVSYLAQGTIYPDIIESASIDGGHASLIKSHHNVGGLPKRMKLKLLEPLRELFKDEVRELGQILGLPKEMLWRHPFPGPGLGVRVLGPIRKSYLDILRQADAILLEEIKQSNWYGKLWQSFCVFVPVRTVGVMGDKRTYDYLIAIRMVESPDAMTADWAYLPRQLLRKISNRIINEVSGVNRVVLDISSKPPSTIEWE